jgi:CubicO group peptidase (beta-lactamase class C family)
MRYYPPNLKYNYSNTNYFLLAAIAERVTHQSFEELMQERVFTPADMVQSRVYNGMQMDTLPHIARGSENRRWHIADFYLNGVTGDKGTYSTTGDLLNLHLALQGNALLSDSIQKVMYTAQSEYKRNKSYALGWRVMQASDTHPEICYHFGWWRGYRSYFIRIPSQNKCLVALCNLSKGEFLPKKDLIDLLMKK